MPEKLAHHITLPQETLVVAGSCMVESQTQIQEIGHMVKENGATVLRSGVDKPRTNGKSHANALGTSITRPSPIPYEWLARSGQDNRILTATEVMGVAHLGIAMAVGIDVFWIGSANGLNYVLIEEVGECGQPVILKDSHGGTFPQFVGAMDHLRTARARAGWSITHTYFCERGTTPGPDNPTRFIPRIDWIAALANRGESVVMDISHPAGSPEYAVQFALAGIMAGAIGIMVEVTLEEGTGAVDGSRQAVGPKRFAELMRVVREWDRIKPSLTQTS